MAAVRLPQRRHKNSQRAQDDRSCPAHRAWVRGHACCVPGCTNSEIECAHVRSGTDGGIGLKPSDRYAISLCRDHHAEQHRIGGATFELQKQINLTAIASKFEAQSPHLRRRRPATAFRSC